MRIWYLVLERIGNYNDEDFIFFSYFNNNVYYMGVLLTRQIINIHVSLQSFWTIILNALFLLQISPLLIAWDEMGKQLTFSRTNKLSNCYSSQGVGFTHCPCLMVSSGLLNYDLERIFFCSKSIYLKQTHLLEDIDTDCAAHLISMSWSVKLCPLVFHLSICM